MSLDLEESPQSDCKMDISDSLESSMVSPERESEANLEENPGQNYHNQNNALYENVGGGGDGNGDVDGDCSGDQPSLVHSHLDNRITIESTSALKTNQIERTLANSHPLMSPTATDSDPEEPNYVSGIDLKCHNNFPDVVPRNERLQQSSNPGLVFARNTLNSARHASTNTPMNVMPLTLLRSHSPDLLSSESEAEVSQYHASVEMNFQSVTLISNMRNEAGCQEERHIKKLNDGIGTLGCEDISSLDSISNHSFEDDDDIEHNLASLSPSSSLLDGLGDDLGNANGCEGGPDLCGGVVGGGGQSDVAVDVGDACTPTPRIHGEDEVGMDRDEPQTLPQYSAVEEHRNSRNWQKITLPGGQVREIDMRVIEPYKRVLSHGGYLKAGGHNAIVMFCACHLPDHSRADYNYVMDNLFLYVVKTLEQLVTEDYILIYLHGGSSRRNMPPFPWLKKCYQLLDHRLRKSLKNMYLVHPTFWIKSIVWMTRPFVSAKFWRKLVYVKSLEELSVHVAVEKAAIPEKVKMYDAKHN